MFESRASNFVPGDTNGFQDIFVRDTCLGAPPGCTPSTTRISVSTMGVQGDGHSGWPVISADGRFVAFESDAENLVANDNNMRRDVFVRDTCAGAPPGCTPSTSRVSVASNGTQGDEGSGRPAISADGRYVAFQSSATNLVASDTNNSSDIFVRDTCFGAGGGCIPSTVRVSLTNGGAQANFASFSADIDDSGRWIVFVSAANNLVTGDGNGVEDVFRRDTCAGADPGCVPSTTRVSLADDGNEAEPGAITLDPAISGNGRYVAFRSSATNLVAGDTNLADDIFIRDTCVGAAPGCQPATTRVSVASDGSQGLSSSHSPRLSATGRYVAFRSSAVNLAPNDTNMVFDVYVRDTCAGSPVACSPATQRVSVSANGAEGNLPSDRPALSADGRLVVFQSDAENLVADDTNGFSDVFLGRTGFRIPVLNAGGTVNAASFVPGAGVAAGSISAVFGVELADGTAVAGAVPLPTTLGGATLQFNSSQGVPKFFASDLQLNIQVPWELAGTGQATLADALASGTSNTVAVDVVEFAPGLFATNQAGTGQGAILIANTPNLAAPMGMFPGSRPAVRGVDFLEIYCTGLGAVTNQPATGAAASANPLSATTTTPTVTVGGVNAPVLFSGLAPGFVGLYVVTLQVPMNAPTGESVPVQLTIGGVPSNTVTIAIE
ncbi:MAG TPA: hypothetical protein VNN18_06065 [Candidatus Xenobia bacterium]|nr:hypothetical protein [Candidatus Xenobia bacterium]